MAQSNNSSIQDSVRQEPSSFSVNEWEVSPSTLCIRNADKTIKLEPKVMQVLSFFAEHAGEVIARQTLEEAIWPDTIVGYDAVTNTIIKLRKAFGDTPREPRFIQTIPKTGYRLIAEVINHDISEESNQTSPHEKMESNAKSGLARWQLAAVLLSALLSVSFISIITWLWFQPSASITESKLALPDKPSIAVMPFLNTSNDPAQSYFSDGLTEDLITDLSNDASLFVIARNSSFRYKGQAIDIKQVSSELGVRYILQGSVRKSDKLVRINAQLLDSATGNTIWAKRYDTPLDDVFAIHDEVATKIMTALSGRLHVSDDHSSKQSQAISAASYDEFLKGWQYYWKFSRDDFALAEQHFNKALEIDPDNSRAHAGLALIYWQSWQQKWHENLGNVHAGWRRASQALTKAMQNPTPLAHSTKSAMFLYNRRFDEAISEAETAVKMNQNHAMGYLALANALAYSGQPGRAIESAQKGMRLDPNFGAPYLEIIGRSQFDMNLYEDSVISLQRALKFNPTERNTLILLVASYGHLKQLEQAKTTLEALGQEHQKQKLRPFTIDWLTNRWPYRQKSQRDHLLAGLEKAGVPRW